MLTGSGGDALPRLRLVHALPGRARLRLDGGDDRALVLDAIERQLRSTPGVTEVRANALTGSLLVVYDVSRSDPFRALELRVDEPGSEIPEAPVATPSSLPATHLMRGFWHADAQISEWTGRRLDLKLAIPCAFLAAGLWELIAGAEIAAASFHTLAWYSYNIFYQLHSREFHPSQPGADAPAPERPNKRAPR